MENNTGVKLSSGFQMLPAVVGVLVCLGSYEWLIVNWGPENTSLLTSIARVVLAATLLGVVWHMQLRRQRRLSDRLAKLLIQQEKLNEQSQRELQEREITQRQLSDQLEFLQILVDSIPAPIFYKDSEGIYTGCNRAFEAFLGKPREEIVGHSVYGVSPGPQAKVYHEKDLELMQQRGHQTYESQVVYADGTLHDVIFNKAAYELQDGRLGGLIGVILDISERKALEKDLVEAKETAEFYSRSKTQFLTNMSHEIRTPLNAIVGFSQILQGRSDSINLPKEFTDILGKISISGQRLAELVNDVLDISRIEAGKVEIIEEDFSLPNLINCILVSCEPQATQKNLHIQSSIDTSLPEFIRSDRGKLSQILINLMGNAIKFSPDNGEIRLDLINIAEKHIQIEVIDEGIGITAEQQDIIFEPFEQVDKSQRGQSRGTGLGLPITRSLVELLGGKIELKCSDTTCGACFQIYLPLQYGQVTPPLEQEYTASNFEFSGKRVLIFEDNPMNQALMHAFCEDLKLHATFTANGHEGIDLAKKIQPDLIFMDIQLPGLDGIQATLQVRQHPRLKDIPVIGLSAAAFSDQRDDALAAGMNEYITKPIALPQLVQSIRKCLK
ncbi:ATP-binding protein [Microbulbifer agarilyticus]|nr:ATP-binding protein [Microbulbifer agarilyticus]